MTTSSSSKIQEDDKGVYYVDAKGRKVYINIPELIRSTENYIRAQELIDELIKSE
jgi:hypothetical protein